MSVSTAHTDRVAAQVYLGRWRWRGLVAVTALIKADERQERAFVREAELLQALRHPNIVSFLGACMEPGRVRMDWHLNGSYAVYKIRRSS